MEELIAFIDYRLQASKKHKKRTEFEAIPYDGIKHLKSAIQSFEDYRKFLNKVLEWHNIYSEGIEHYDVQKILKPILLARDSKTNQLYIRNFIDELIRGKQIDEVLVCAQYLPSIVKLPIYFCKYQKKGLSIIN